MSDDLYCTVLRWREGAGLSKLHNRAVALAEKPELGFEFDELHYRPSVQYSRVRFASGLTREALPAEIEAMDAFLRASAGSRG